MSVKRYDLVGDMDGNCNVNEARMEHSEDGDYVSYEDYAALEARCAVLAAENAGMKKFCKDAAFDADYEAELGMERGGFTDALNNIKTPATDAFLAEVRAQGVESAGEYLEQYAQGLHEEARLVLQDAGELCNGFAAQLRKGAQS